MTAEEILLPEDPIALYAWLTNFLNKIDEIALQLNIPDEEIAKMKDSLNLQLRITLEEIEDNDRKHLAELALAEKRKALSRALYKYVLTQKHGRD